MKTFEPAAPLLAAAARYKPAVAHGHPVSSVFQFNTSIVTRPAQP